MALGTELFNLATSFDPYGAYRKGQMAPEAYDVEQQKLGVERQKLDLQKLQLGEQQKELIAEQGKPPELATMAQNVLGPQYKLTDENGMPTVAGQMNDLKLRANQEVSQGKKYLQQAKYYPPGSREHSNLTDAGRRLITTGTTFEKNAAELQKKEQNTALYGLATAANQDEWNNVVKGWERNGMPIPKGFPMEYSPENMKKIAAMAPLEVQEKIRTELRRRDEAATKERKEARQETRNVIRDREKLLELAEKYGIPVDPKIIEEVFKDVKPGATVPPEKINQAVSASPSTPIPEQVLSSLKDEFKTKFNTDIPITSGTRTREQQQDLYNRAQKGEKGIYIPTNPANFPNKQTFHDNAIDVGTNAPAGTEAFLNSKGFFRPFPKEDPVHYEFKGVPTQEKSEGVILQKRGVASGKEDPFIKRSMVSITQASDALENLSSLPITTTSPLFGQKNFSGLLTAPLSAINQKMDDVTSQKMQTRMAGVSRSLASLESGGAATGLVGLTESIEKGVAIPAGAKLEVALDKMAEMRRIVESSAKVMLNDPKISQERKDLINKELELVKKAIPYTQKEIDLASAASKGMLKGVSKEDENLTFSEFMQKYPGGVKADSSENKTSTGVTWSIPK